MQVATGALGVGEAGLLAHRAVTEDLVRGNVVLVAQPPDQALQRVELRPARFGEIKVADQRHADVVAIARRVAGVRTLEADRATGVDAAGGVDQVGASLDAHRLFAVHVFFAPSAILFRHFVVGVG